jgi:hypothetical protein
VALEGVYGARTEGVRDDLSLAAMLCAVAHVEDTRYAGDKGFVVDAGMRSDEACGGLCHHSLFQKPISMSIHRVQSFGLCNRDVIVPNANNRPVLLVCPVNPGKLLAPSGTEGKPGVAEFSQPWSGYASEVFVCGEVWKDIIMTKSERCEYCRETPVAQDRHVECLSLSVLEGLVDSGGVANERGQWDVILIPGGQQELHATPTFDSCSRCDQSGELCKSESLSLAGCHITVD